MLSKPRLPWFFLPAVFAIAKGDLELFFFCKLPFCPGKICATLPSCATVAKRLPFGLPNFGWCYDAQDASGYVETSFQLPCCATELISFCGKLQRVLLLQLPSVQKCIAGLLYVKCRKKDNFPKGISATSQVSQRVDHWMFRWADLKIRYANHAPLMYDAYHCFQLFLFVFHFFDSRKKWKVSLW